MKLWNVADPARPGLVAVIHDSGTYVFSVAFSPGGRTLAGASADDLTRLWNVSDPGHPGVMATLTGPSEHVYSVGFGPGGRTIAAADSAGLVWLWDTRPRDAAAAVCAMAGQPLTRPEWRAYAPGRPYAPPCSG